MREINNDIKMKTSDIYYQAIQNIIGILQTIQQTFNETADQIENNKEKIDYNYSRLVLCVTILRKYGWTFELCDDDVSVLDKNGGNNNNNNNNGSNNGIFDTIEETLTKKCEKLFEKANRVLRAKNLLDLSSGLKGLERKLLKQIFAQRKEQFTPFITDGCMNLMKRQILTHAVNVNELFKA